MRYLRLYSHFLRFSFSKAMEFRFDFFFRIIMDCIFYVVNIAFYRILFLSTPFVAGWSEDQVMLFVAGYLLVDAIHMTVFSSNMWWLPYIINRGDLDYHLVRPVSTLFIVSLREFAANSFMNVIIATGIFVWALNGLQMEYTVWSLLGFLLLIINGVVLQYVLQMIFIVPVFWTQSSRGFNDFFFSMGVSIERPDRIFKGWVRLLFTVVFPFALIMSFPARLFLEPWDSSIFLHLAGVTAMSWGIMLLLWRKGLAAYSSASS